MDARDAGKREGPRSILASIALVFFVGVMLKYWILR